MATSLGRFYAIFGADTSEFTRKMGTIGTKMSSVGKKMTMGLTLPLVALAGAAVKFGADFEQAIANAASVAGGTTEEYVKNLKEMEKIARDMGATTVFSAKEAADGLYFMASAGWDVDKMGKAIKPTLDLAAATQNDLAFTTETVVAALNSFGLEASETIRVTDVFSGVISSSQATLDKLSNSMTYIGPLAKSLGWSIEETAAALGKLYDAGIPASTAGTSLRMSMQKLLDPTSKTTKGLKTLGLTIEQVDPRFHSLEEIIDVFSKTTMDAQAVTQIFGARGMTAILKLADAGAPAIADLTEKISKSGTTAEMAARQLDTLKGSWKLTTSALSEAGIQIAQILMPALRSMLNDYIVPAIQKFSALTGEKKKFIVAIAGILALGGPLLMLFGKLTTATATFGAMTFKLLPVLGAVTVAVWLAYQAHKALLDIRDKHIKKTGKMGAHVTEETKAWDKLQKEVGTFSDVLTKVSGKMKESGVSFKDRVAIIKKLKEAWSDGGQSVREYKKIIEGEYGPAVKKALMEVAGVHVEAAEAARNQMKSAEELEAEAKELAETLSKSLAGALDDVETKLGETTGGTEKLTQAQIEAKEQAEAWAARLKDLGIKTIPQKKAAVITLKAELEKLNQEYTAGLIDLEDYLRASKELNAQIKDLSTTLTTTAVPAARDMTGIIENAAGVFKDLVPPVKEVSKETTKATEKIKFDWEGVAEDMGSVWAEGFKGIIDNTSTFADLLNNTFDSISAGISSTAGKLVEGLAEKAGGVLKALGPVLGAVASTVATAALGMVKKLFNIKSTAEKAAAAAAQAERQFENQVQESITSMSQYGEISESTAEKIAELRKTHKGYIAESLALADVIKDVGVNQDNLNGLWGRAVDVIHQMNDGQIDATKGAEVLDEAFSQLVEGAQKLGEEGSDAMKAFIEKTREAGLEIASVTGYINEQLGVVKSSSMTAAEGLQAMADHIPVDKVAELRKEQKRLLEEMDELSDGTEEYAKLGTRVEETDVALGGAVAEQKRLLEELTKVEEGSDAYKALQKEIKANDANMEELRETQIGLSREIAGVEKGTEEYEKLGLELAKVEFELENTAQLSHEMANDLESQALRVFNAMIANGASYSDAMDSLGGTLDTIIQAHEDLGIEGGVAIKELLHIRKVTQENESLFNAIDGNVAVLTALRNTASLSEEALTDAATQASKYYDELVNAGLSGDQALAQMAPTLQILADESEKYGTKLDENTQRLIDQAKEMGLVTEAQETEQDQQERLFGGLADKMGDIMDELGDRIEGIFGRAFGNSFSDAERRAGKARKGIDKEFSDMDYDVDLNVDEGGTRGGDRGGRDPGGLATGGIVFSPSVKRVAEIEPEIWTPFSKVKDLVSGIAEGLRGGGGTNIYFSPKVYAMDQVGVEKWWAGPGRKGFVKTIKGNVGGVTKEIKVQTEKFSGK